MKTLEEVLDIAFMFGGREFEDCLFSIIDKKSARDISFIDQKDFETSREGADIISFESNGTTLEGHCYDHSSKALRVFDVKIPNWENYVRTIFNPNKSNLNRNEII